MADSQSDPDSPPAYSETPHPGHSGPPAVSLIDRNPPRGPSGRIGSHPSSTGPHPYRYIPQAPLCTPGYEDLIFAAPEFPRGLPPLLRDVCLCEMAPASNESIQRVADFSQIPVQCLRRLARLGAMVQTPGVGIYPPSVFFRTRALPARMLAVIMHLYLDEVNFYAALDDYNAQHGRGSDSDYE